MAEGVERYGLDKVFERIVGAACAFRPKLVGQIAKAIDPNGIVDATARLTIEAALAIYKDAGRGPASAAIVMQRLRRWMSDGKVTQDQIDDVAEMLALAPLPLPADEEILTELLPILQRKLRHRAIQESMDAFANRRNMDRAQSLMRAADKLGSEDAGVGLAAGPDAFDEVRDLRYAEQLPLGVPELDILLGGGIRRRTATCFVAAEGAGKSQILTHVAAYACALGYNVGYVTLELARGYIFTRWASNLTLVPVRDILGSDGDDAAAEAAMARAKESLRKVWSILGAFTIKEMAPGATTMKDIRAWVREVEEESGKKLDVLVVDFADKLGSHKQTDRSTYDAMGTVYDDFRYFAHEENKWAFTASQAQRGKDVRIVRTDNASDSKKKMGAVDYGIGVTVTDEGVMYQLGKHRMGDRQGATVGPIPHDFSHSRLVVGGLYDRLRLAMEGA